MNRISLLIGSIAAGLLFSCSSPLDIDTPREREYPGGRAVARTATVTFRDFGTGGPEDFVYDCVWDAPIEIDTGDVPKLWMRGLCSAPPGSGDGLMLRSLRLDLGGLPLDGGTVSIDGAPGDGSGAEITLPIGDGIYYPDGTMNLVTINLTHDAVRRRLEGPVRVTVFIGRELIIDGSIVVDY